MVVAASYPFLNIFWTMILFFAWVAWIWMVIDILRDIFRRRDIGGWGKAAWCILLIVVPFIGALTYVIAQHDGMAERSAERLARAEQDFDARIRAAGPTNGGAASEIQTAADLRERGAISDAEYEELKDRVLTAH
jgi:Phospholipase_D-nuclease N-terminal/Short C-terminal domain